MVIIHLRANKLLKIENKRYELLAGISNECLFEYFPQQNQLTLSGKCQELLGDSEIIKETTSILESVINEETHPGPSQRTIIKLPLANGNQGVFRIVNSNIYDTNRKLYSVIGKLVDVSEEIAEKEKLIVQSQLDGLTGFYNHTTTKRLITESILDRAGPKTDALIVLDCDDFKRINDTYGHLVGDKLLQNISKDILLTFRETDIIGRIGGDEFCIYMRNIPSIDFVQLKCWQLSVLIQETNKDHHILVSIGIAELEDETTYEELFARADAALYKAKAKGGGRIEVSEGKGD